MACQSLWSKTELWGSELLVPYQVRAEGPGAGPVKVCMCVSVCLCAVHRPGALLRVCVGLTS